MRILRANIAALIGMAAVLCVLSQGLGGCTRNNEEITEPGVEPSPSEQGYLEFFLEKGSDVDSSYISLRGTLKDGALKLQATSWGIRETGLFLARKNAAKTAIFVFMGECGTVSSRTWEKKSISYTLALADQDTTDRIIFTSHGDTVNVVRSRVYVVPDSR